MDNSGVLASAGGGGLPLLDLMWTMLMVAGLVLWTWYLVVVFSDLYRRQDIGGWGKAGWTVVLIVVPLVAVLGYLIVQGGHMAERRHHDAALARRAVERETRRVAEDQRQDPVTQITTAKRLLEQGDITRDEFEILKRRALDLPALDPTARMV